jgi:hypothetical protein
LNRRGAFTKAEAPRRFKRTTPLHNASIYKNQPKMVQLLGCITVAFVGDATAIPQRAQYRR